MSVRLSAHQFCVEPHYPDHVGSFTRSINKEGEAPFGRKRQEKARKGRKRQEKARFKRSSGSVRRPGDNSTLLHRRCTCKCKCSGEQALGARTRLGGELDREAWESSWRTVESPHNLRPRLGSSRAQAKLGPALLDRFKHEPDAVGAARRLGCLGCSGTKP